MKPRASIDRCEGFAPRRQPRPFVNPPLTAIEPAVSTSEPLEPRQEWLSPNLYDAIESFDHLLADRCGIHLAREGGGGERALGHVLDLVSAFNLETPADYTRDLRAALRAALGMVDLASKVVHVATHPDFGQICAHLRLLLAKDSHVVQSAASPVTDSESNKVFELLIGLSVMQFATNVRFDHPVDSSGGTNPDILGDFDGRTWGFACKAMHTPNVKSYADAVRRAVEQIHASRADAGFAVISLKNVVNHDASWIAVPREDGEIHYAAWPSAEEADLDLETQVGRLLDGWEEAFGGEQEIAAVFAGRAVPVVLNYVHSVTLVERNGEPVLTTLRRIIPLALGLPLDSSAVGVLNSLDRAVQSP